MVLCASEVAEVDHRRGLKGIKAPRRDHMCAISFSLLIGMECSY